jgi:hypothetical protein
MRHRSLLFWVGEIAMNSDRTSQDQTDEEEEDYAPELEMGAVDPEFDLEPPIDPPIIPAGRDGAEVPGAIVEDPLDDDEGPSTPNPYSDDEITARVRRLLRSDSATSMLRIDVSTEDGIVTLRGSVQTLDDTDNAAEVASRVDGVVDVIDELEVEL